MTSGGAQDATVKDEEVQEAARTMYEELQSAVEQLPKLLDDLPEDPDELTCDEYQHLIEEVVNTGKALSAVGRKAAVARLSSIDPDE